MSKERMTMRVRTIIATVATVLSAASLTAAAPALASEGIETFEIGISSTQAGAHPDFRTKITLEDPGQPEAARGLRV